MVDWVTCCDAVRDSRIVFCIWVVYDPVVGWVVVLVVLPLDVNCVGTTISPSFTLFLNFST